MGARGLNRRQFIRGLTGSVLVPAGAVDLLAGAPAAAASAPPAETWSTPPLQLAAASTRAHLTTAEAVELALVTTQGDRAIALEARHEDGSVVALACVLPGAGATRATIVTLPAGMLKPGTYAIVASDGAHATPAVHLAIHRDDHPNAYFVAAWMHQTADGPTALAKGGWMYFSSDLVNASVRKPARDDVMERYVAARMKPYSLTVMGGGHQLDLDVANDWGDPWVQRAVSWKMSLAALSNRLYPSAGLSAFDEPGLTWWRFHGPDGKLAGMNPFAVPAQVEDFRRLTGTQMPTGTLADTMPRYKAILEAWLDFVAMRLRYLEQAWWAAVTAVDQVHAPFVTINQVASSYAAGLVTDGVDNRMNRPYRVVNGHGGYSEVGSWAPVLSARGYDGWSWDRPHYFLPVWGTHDYARMRQEIWLPWSTKLEGIQYDPNHGWALSGGYLDATAVLEIAEVNRRMALVGDVLTRMPRTRAPVAVLLSHTQYAHDLAMGYRPGMADPTAAYGSAHRQQVKATMWRAFGSGIAPNWLDEHEVVEKGVAFLGQWKVVYCPGLAVARPDLRRVLEAYVAAGGKLVQGEGDPLAIAGSIRVRYAYAGGEAPPESGVLFNDLAIRKHGMELAPGFERDLWGWLGPQRFRSHAPANAMLMSVHAVGDASYVLLANNSQDPENVRHVQIDPIPLETTIDVPPGGVLYDLFHGGAITPVDGKAPLRLAAGDGACWLHLPSPPGRLKLAVALAPLAWALDVSITWGTAGYLPFRLRLFDPSGALVDELFRATTPEGSTPLAYGAAPQPAPAAAGGGPTTFRHRLALGTNATAGTWTVEAHEWLTGSTETARATVRPAASGGASATSADDVSVYFDDARKIGELFAGHPRQPPFDRMNPDCRRVFKVDAARTTFAVFGPEDGARPVADALRRKGMSVAVNPAYKVVPFEREPGHGGTGPVVDHGAVDFENVYAHTIVLPGHPLGASSWERGHINRPITSTFPGPGRAYVQWGSGGYKAGFENVWVFGDASAGARWLLAAIDGTPPAREPAPLAVSVRAGRVGQPAFARRLAVTQEIKLWDTPTGIGASPDGAVIYALLAGGSVAAYDHAGRRIWETRALLQGGCLAVSPRGDRVAVGGFPGLLVLDAANGKVLGGYRAAPLGRDQSFGHSRMIAAAWNDDGTRVAGGGVRAGTTSTAGGAPPVFALPLLDANGAVEMLVSEAVAGDVMGLAFVPRTSTLLVGAAQLTAVETASGNVAWRSDLAGAQSFAFSADGKKVAAGGWGKRAATFTLADGKALAGAAFGSNVGGVALLPDGDVAVAVWGGTHPLYRLRAGEPEPGILAQSRFAFHDVVAWGEEGSLLAAEQGGPLWLFDSKGTARATLGDAGTTAHRMIERGDEALVGRMNRVVQRVRAR